MWGWNGRDDRRVRARRRKEQPTVEVRISKRPLKLKSLAQKKAPDWSDASWNFRISRDWITSTFVHGIGMVVVVGDGKSTKKILNA